MELQSKVAVLLSSIPEWLGKAFMPVLGVVVVGWDYFLGQAYYTAWLQAFQVDSNVFARAHETILIYGALAFLHAGVGLTTWAGAHWLAMVSAVLYFAFCFTLWSAANHNRPHTERRDEARDGEVQHSCVARFFFMLFVLLCIVLMFFMGVPVLGAFTSLPGTIGEMAGTAAAREDRADYDQGCEASASTCIVLKKDGAVIAQGFRIAQSPERIALYRDGVTKEYALVGLSIETAPKVAQPAPPTQPHT